MKTIYQIFAIILIASFICFAFSSCVSKLIPSNVNHLHSSNENDDANTAIILNKQIIARLDSISLVEQQQDDKEENNTSDIEEVDNDDDDQ